VLWIESRRALVTGDTLVDRGKGLEFLPEWAPEGVPAEEILEALQPLRELPVEIVLPTHGPPVDRAALERALDA
jgi:glyoxylase-like metal-dependent hydrolase (beta-lactamase superfamily II)